MSFSIRSVHLLVMGPSRAFLRSPLLIYVLFVEFSSMGPSRALCDPHLSSASLLLRLVFCELSLGFSWPCCKKFRQRCVCRWYFLSFPQVSLGLLQEVISLAMLLPLDSAGTSRRLLVAIGLLQ